MAPTTFLFALLSLLPIISSAPAPAGLPPKQDPFYVPTGNWKSSKPGTILSHRVVPHPLINVTYTHAYQLLYRTTTALGDPTAAVTTVIVPPNPDFSKLLSYQIVYDTPDVNCAPSYVLQQGGPNAFDAGFTFGLGEGWVVNTADYENPRGEYTVGTSSGWATLDSIRAALASTNITKVEADATVAMWGYSGGALASEWAAELQPSYAPELNISGTCIGGITPNVTSVLLSINGKPNAGLIPAGIVGVANAYPAFAKYLNASFVSPAKQKNFWSANNECLIQLETQDLNDNFFPYFINGEALLESPIAVEVVNRSGIMGLHGVPAKTNKMYFYKSVFDEISPIADTDALFKKYCADGVTIQYSVDNYGTHEAEATNGGLGAVEFLLAIFSGDYKQTGCTRTVHNKAGSIVSATTLAPATATTSV